MRSFVYLVAVTADGFIAGPDGDVTAFETGPAALTELFERYPETCPAHAREALGVTGEPARFDTVVMGRRTHQPALDAGLTAAYPHLQGVVVTSDRTLPPDPSIAFVHDDPGAAVRTLKRRPGLDLWLCGGGALAAQLVDEIDELVLKVHDVVIGDGIPLFRGPVGTRRFTRVSSERLGGEVELVRLVRS